MKKEELQAILQTRLVDDETPYGGTAFAGETFSDFIADPDIQPLWKKIVLATSMLTHHPDDAALQQNTSHAFKAMDDVLIECGIRPLFKDKY
ncbi:hypothetical protein ACI3E1_07080 [Ligilactobacillus sp. LYQ139]|uniref:hypothetical protein n=1 Tax=Ligilactobacillus sp. LYQ139 TaxID=3378800 RepID=UPI003854810F